MPVLFLLAILFSAALSEAQVAPAADLPLNQQVTVQTSPERLTAAVAPKKLWSRWGKGEGPEVYVGVYRFTVTPGQKYTLFGHFKPDGVYRNFYVVGDNPLTDTDYSFGKSSGYTTMFVALGQQPSKENCATVTRRYNLTIAPDSEHHYLYLVVTSKAPAQALAVALRTPADSDEDVSRHTNDPACAARKGNTWGTLWPQPSLLKLDPAEKATPAAPVSTRTRDDGGGLPLNQKVRVETAASPQGTTPKKLWSRYAKNEGGPVYLSVYYFAVTPGERYTFYAWFKPDGVYRNVYIAGDNPGTDVDYSFGKSGNRGWVVLNQQPWKENCEEVTRRENFTVSPESTQNHLYLVVQSKTPSQAIHVMLKSPADPDDEVNRNTSDPACSARKGNTWGRLWSGPLLLQLDPSEPGGR